MYKHQYAHARQQIDVDIPQLSITQYNSRAVCDIKSEKRDLYRSISPFLQNLMLIYPKEIREFWS